MLFQVKLYINSESFFFFICSLSVIKNSFTANICKALIKVLCKVFEILKMKIS